MNRKQAAKKYGDTQVFQWRRFFDNPPPLISKETAIQQAKKEIFKDVPIDQFPRGESLQDTLKRVLPIWNNHILTALNKNQNVLVVAHGNSIRALLKHIQKIEDDKICELEIPTAHPMVLSIPLPTTSE